MTRLLIINPNTTDGVSLTLEAHAKVVAGAGVEVRVLTARFGAAYISCETSYAVAAHAALDAWAYALAHEPTFDAVLLGCFGDPGLFALREQAHVPVTGLAEASFLEAQALGDFAVVTGGARWKPMLERLAYSLGLGGKLAGLHTVDASGAELASDPAMARTLLIQACREAAQKFPTAKALILGGAALAGVAATLQAEVPLPVVDSVAAGVRHALALARSKAAPTATAMPVEWSHVSPELAALGRARQA